MPSVSRLDEVKTKDFRLQNHRGKSKKAKKQAVFRGAFSSSKGFGGSKSQPSILNLLCSLDIEEVGHFSDDSSVGTAAESVLF